MNSWKVHICDTNAYTNLEQEAQNENERTNERTIRL